MLLHPFAGSERFIQAVDGAVRAASRNPAEALRGVLCGLIGDASIQLPACVYNGCADHYGRREIYRSQALGYSVVAMTWEPGQGTALHDHSGMWCVEGVWRGTLEITQYELAETRGGRHRFQAVGTQRAGVGSTGCLIPPHEYHVIRNPSAGEQAVSVHIYQNPMLRCSVFQAQEDGWYERQERQLALD